MDDYFLWLPIFFGSLVVFFCAHTFIMFKADEYLTSILCLIFTVICIASLLAFIFENGNGHAIGVKYDGPAHRLIPGQMYEVVYQSRGGSEVLLRGIDGVLYYSFEKPVPPKFIVGKDYSLQPLNATPSQ